MRTTFVSLILSLTIALPLGAMAAFAPVDHVFGHACKTGRHQQPKGPFAVYAFCDDALGTNIAIFYSELGDPRFPKWTLTRRFWQDEAWSADVHDLAWVPKRNFLVVTTSEIYGNGGVYLLDLEKQQFVVLAEPKDCGSRIVALDESSVTVALNDCESSKPNGRRVLKFPMPDSGSAGQR
jgi:hypothetical protein